MHERIQSVTSVYDAGFTPRAATALAKSGRATIEAVLSIEDYFDLHAIRGLGIKSSTHVMKTMRRMGHHEWVDKMVTGMESFGLHRYIYAELNTPR
jgi:hypothetical protein